MNSIRVAGQSPAVLLLSIFAVLVCTGCPSFSTLQTPRTVPRGQVRFAVAPEAVGASTSGDSVVAPQTEIGLRYGVSDNVDIGAKLYFLGAEFGAKFMLLRGNLDLAVAPAASFMSVSSGSGDTSSSFTSLYLHLPILFGVNINDSLTVGFGPKFLYIAMFGSATSSDTSVFASGSSLLGGVFLNLPIRVGDAFWIAPEINIYSNISNMGSADPFGTWFYQGGLAFLFGGAEPTAANEAVYTPPPGQAAPAATPAGYDASGGQAAPPPTY